MRLTKNRTILNILIPWKDVLRACYLSGFLAIPLSGCVVEPMPAPPPPVVAAPGAYYAAPWCCYTYSEYLPYYYGYAGPTVALGFGYGGGWHGGRWR